MVYLKTQTHKLSGICFGFFRGEIDHPPQFYLVFTKEISSK